MSISFLKDSKPMVVTSGLWFSGLCFRKDRVPYHIARYRVVYIMYNINDDEFSTSCYFVSGKNSVSLIEAKFLTDTWRAYLGILDTRKDKINSIIDKIVYYDVFNPVHAQDIDVMSHSEQIAWYDRAVCGGG